MEEIVYIIGQVMGVVAILLGILSYQMHTQKRLLVVQIATTVVFSLHYLMIGAISGMALNVVCSIRNIAYFWRNQKQKQDKLLPIVFTVILGIVGVLTWEAWYSVFVFVGLVINTLCMSFSDPQKVRASILVTSPMVIVYDVFALSIGGIVYESVVIVSSLVGLLRFHKGKCSKNGKTV